MKNIFVFTAGDPNAKIHIKDTIEKAIPPEKVLKHFRGKELEIVKSIGLKHSFYAWGALPGPGNISTWAKMNEGDYVIVDQNNNYTYFSKVLFKAVNASFANDNWGMNEEGTGTWDHIYLLEKPEKLDPPIPVSNLNQYLHKAYRGFTRLSDQKIETIQKEFGSIESFVNAKILVKNPKKSLSIWWVNQGESYKEESAKKYIWAPKEGKNGATFKPWTNISSVSKGDIIFNYAEGALRGISIAQEKGYSYENEGPGSWNKTGIRVDITHFQIDSLPIVDIKKYKNELASALGDIVGPFEKEGDIKQGYLYEFNVSAGRVIRRIYNKTFPDPFERIFYGPIAIISRNTLLDLANKKLQIILYGPPGTGKTFKTKAIAMSLLREYENEEVKKNGISNNRTKERVWIFQANPNIYDLVSALSDPEYKKTSWNVAQYKNQINKGDIVLLWLSGKKAGIYAVAEITSDPIMEMDSFEDVKYWRTNEPRVERLAVRINIINNLVKNPVFREELKEIKELNGLSIFGFSQATNFSVRNEEWEIIQQRVREHQ